MTAEIVSIGTELLLGQIVDTHAATIACILADCGIVCRRRSTVGDNLERICSTLGESMARADVVITIGGLGPTQDDLTRDAIAKVLGVPLERVPEMEDQLRAFFQSQSLTMSDSILRQADRPRGGQFIENPNGTAPGLIVTQGNKTFIALPGPKGEFDPMADGPVRTLLAEMSGELFHSVILRIVGIGESQVEARVAHLMDQENPTVAPYAQTGEVHLRVTARAPDRAAAEAIAAPTIAAIRAIIGSNVFGTDSKNLESAVHELLLRSGCTVSVAESMTGGELAARLSSAPGSSKVFLGGIVCYTAETKWSLLGISKDLIEEHGAVSEEVARELATRIRDRSGSTFGIGVTGNAGPTVDSGDKPIGHVYIALAGPTGIEVRESQFRAQRADIRRRATQSALMWLRDALLPLQPSA